MTPRLSPLHCIPRPSVCAALLHVGLGVSLALCGIAASASAQARPARARVPAVAPDSVPRAIFDSLVAPANLLRNPPGITGLVVRNALYVRFHDGASRQERQDAIDAVAGDVLGGVPAPFSFYVVKIDAAMAPGDSSSGPLLRAYRRLLRFPTVRGVAPLFLDGPARGYLQPSHGASRRKPSID
jgi:hypothetical protein